ncbi:MAG: GGDEF domain-containing protein [Anaerolineaceae bacterium]|nr:GGDEF domain-containing protein [Anaerolineaceae bacterium]
MVLLTMASMLASTGISVVLRWLIQVEISISGLLISLIIPLVLTPFFGSIFFKAYFELEEMRTQLSHLSVTDDLTQVYNRRYFIGRANDELSRAKRYGQVFSMLLLDLDDFKQTNDRLGHPAGDEVLCMVADTCVRAIREVDVLARYGGDEFALLIPNLDQQHAWEFAERLRTLLDESVVAYEGHAIQITVSIGVVTWTPAITDLDGLIYLMDKALYDAKRAGKDTIKVLKAHS